MTPADRQLAESLIGRVNAAPLCGKPPGAVLLTRLVWDGWAFTAGFTDSGRPPEFDGGKAIAHGDLVIECRPEPADQSARYAVGVYNEFGWNRFWNPQARAWQAIVRSDRTPVYPAAEIPDTLDVRVEDAEPFNYPTGMSPPSG